MPIRSPWFARLARFCSALLLVLLASGCAGAPNQPTPTVEFGSSNASPTALPATSAPTAVPPTAAPSATAIPPTPTPVPAPLVDQQIAIDSPPPGTLVGSPVVLTGRTAAVPAKGTLDYRVTNNAGQQIGGGTVPVSAAPNGGGFFNAGLTFNLPQNGGDIHIDLVDTAADGTVLDTAGIDLYVAAQAQQITIDSPPPGTQVGSPVVITGNVARSPFQGKLGYLVTNSRQQQIGAGQFDVPGAPGRPTSYVGSLTFDAPLNGDNITVQLYDRDPTNGAIVASQSIALVVAPAPQAITINSPPPGVNVGSPMTISGSTVRFPFNGALNYRVTDANGVQIGAGSFGVTGNVNTGSTFSTPATFTLPRDGGLVRLTVYDQNPSNGAVVASSSVDLQVIPQYQAIFIDSPPPGTQVGSPVVLTGRTNQYPNGGGLTYRVTDASGRQLGTGTFPVNGGPGQRGSFTASLTFNLPPNGGPIRVELLDRAANGNVAASAALDLTVAPPPPPQIIIDSPPPGTQVGSPVVLTGRVTALPPGGLVSYRVFNDGGQLGFGQFAVTQRPGQTSDYTFTASLVFQEPPVGGNVTVQLTAPNPMPGQPPLSATIVLYVAPKIQPLANP